MPVITNAEAEAILAGLPEERITLDYIESRVRSQEFINPSSAPQLTICLLVLDNGFCAIGQSAPARVENFHAELGKKYARENAIRSLWAQFGFALCEKHFARNAGSVLPGLTHPVPTAAGNVAGASQLPPETTTTTE